jgi:hypothetical protein
MMNAAATTGHDTRRAACTTVSPRLATAAPDVWRSRRASPRQRTMPRMIFPVL